MNKGLDLGNDKVKYWLISMLISFLVDLFVTMPFLVKKIMIFLNILKTSGDRNDMDLERKTFKMNNF